MKAPVFRRFFLVAGSVGCIASTAAAQASLSNPVLSTFTDILFVERSTRTDLSGSEFDGDHMCDQYHAFNARKGGGLFILKNFKTNPQKVDVVAGLKVPSGANAGMLLSDGAFISPDLSYDGKTIVFGWTSGGTEPWVQANRFNLFRVDIDGTNLKRLTDINQDDFDPCWLPNDRIVFISTRRGGFGRCHPHAKPTFTMYSMKADGSDLYCIDYHETNEWHPSVDNDGMIVYSRWDYIDRDSDIAHHMWTCFPDGRDPRSRHGNYPYPWSTIPGTEAWNLYKGDGRHKRPWIEQNIRAIPNTSGLYVATAALHHGQAFGSLILIDVNAPDDNLESQLTRLTPEVKFPEAETGTDQSWEKYGTAWPFSKDLFLCNYTNGIYFYDASSKSKALIYQATANKFRPIDPIPVQARKAPPKLPIQTCQGELNTSSSPNATITVQNVLVGDMPLPAGVKIKYMRMVQVFPKTTPLVDNPKVHYGLQGLCRMSLGTVPVESDGSVYCKAPVGKEIYFQLLDEKGLAVQSMRSGTYVHSGEQMTCTGCHENKWSATPGLSQRIATQRPPSEITPEPPGLEPINFYRTVKPVFDAQCAVCHKQKGKGPDMSYGSLRSYAFYFDAGGNGSIMNGTSGGSRTIPGIFGARYSKLYKDGHLDKTHYNVSLTDSDFRRITLWLDLNSYELSAYHNVSQQQQGQLVWPAVDAEPTNPQGVESRAVATLSNGPAGLSARLQVNVMRGTVAVALPFDGPYSVQLFGVNGTLVRRVRGAGSGNVVLPIKHCTPGMYLLTVAGEKAYFTHKVVVH